MLAIPCNLDLFKRTQLLLSKPNQIQRQAAFTQQNLRWLVQENPSKFTKVIMPEIFNEVTLSKDIALCDGIDTLTETGLIEPQRMLELADHIIQKVCLFNKNGGNEGVRWMQTICKILSKNTANLQYVEMALQEIGDPDNNHSSQRLASKILVVLAHTYK